VKSLVDLQDRDAHNRCGTVGPISLNAAMMMSGIGYSFVAQQKMAGAAL
jgi:hypothetical protein